MGNIEWDASLETGNPKIDEQHQALIEAFNQLQAAIERGRAREEVSRTLMFLTNYTVAHFRMEEELMDRGAYPDAGRHKRLHHGLVVSLSELMKHYAQGAASLTVNTMQFLEGWLVEHIQGEDRRLAEIQRH